MNENHVFNYWKGTSVFIQLIDELSKHDIVFLYGPPKTGKASLIEQLDYPEYRQKKTQNCYINFGKIPGETWADKKTRLIEISNEKKNKIIVKASEYDLLEVLNIKKVEESNDYVKNFATKFKDHAQNFFSNLQNNINPPDRNVFQFSLFIPHADGKKLLENIIINAEIKFLDEVQKKEVYETLLTYARISADEIPKINLQKGYGYYFPECFIESLALIQDPDLKIIDNVKLKDFQKNKMKSAKYAESFFLSNPGLFLTGPNSTCSTSKGIFSLHNSQFLVSLTREFSQFLYLNETPLQEISKKVLADLPIVGIPLTLVFFLKQKENNSISDFLIKFPAQWKSIPDSKKEAIGEWYDRFLGIKKGTSIETFEKFSGIEVASLKERISKLESDLKIIEMKCEQNDIEHTEFRSEINQLKEYRKKLKFIIPYKDCSVYIVFEKYSRYPFLNFSVVNNTPQTVQITSIHIVKAATLKDEHESIRYLLGPKTKLSFSLSKSKIGEWENALGDSFICDLKSGDIETFQLSLECINTVNMLDFEVEYITPGSRTPLVILSPEIVLIHSPVPSDSNNGEVLVLNRHQAFSNLFETDLTKTQVWKTISSCDNGSWLLLRGAAYLTRDNFEEGWNKLIGKYETKPEFGPILASFSELVDRQRLPDCILNYLFSWIQNPEKIIKIFSWDEESHSIIIFDNLVGISRDKDEFILKILDSTICVPNLPENGETQSEIVDFMKELSLYKLRITAIEQLLKKYKEGCTEYIIANIIVDDHIWFSLHRMFCEFHPGIEEFKNCYDKEEIVEFWLNWWKKAKSEKKYSVLDWKRQSPRLYQAFYAFQACSETELIELSSDPDPVVRLKVTQNPRTPLIALRRLTQDNYSSIRLSVVSHKNVDMDCLKILAHDKNILVQKRVRMKSP